MASFFFQDTASAEGQPGERPALTSVKCGPSSAEADGHAAGAPSQGGRRAEVSPPDLFLRSQPAWKAWAANLWTWLWRSDSATAKAPPMTALRKVKSEFNSSIWDLQSMHANHVRTLIEQARSLRELWHLRTDVFRVISMHRGQIEAQLRLDALDSHFPVRSSQRPAEARAGKVTSW